MLISWLVITVLVSSYTAVYLALIVVQERRRPSLPSDNGLHELPQDHAVTFVDRPLEWTNDHRDDTEVVDWSKEEWV